MDMMPQYLLALIRDELLWETLLGSSERWVL